MKFVLFSDLHLDAPFAGLGRDGRAAARRRQALRDTLRNVVALAIEVQADALLCGGDLYEHESFTDDTLRFVQMTFAALHRLPVYIAPGNHDYLCPSSLYARADWSPNVHVFQSGALTPVPLSDGLTLWGAAHSVPAGTPDFLDGFRVDRGGGHLALFHGSERGWLGEQGTGKQPHAPFDAAQIPAAGLHHAFLGHYHRAKAAPYHTYPGNPCPLAFGEDAGRGAVIASLQPDMTVERVWRDVAACQVSDRSLSVNGCQSLEDVRDRLASGLQGLEGCVRIRLTGEVPAELDLNRAALETAGSALDAFVLDLRDVQVAYDVERLSQEQTVRGAFVRDVLVASDLDEDQRRRLLVTGLRALDGRSDLEVE